MYNIITFEPIAPKKINKLPRLGNPKPYPHQKSSINLRDSPTKNDFPFENVISQIKNLPYQPGLESKNYWDVNKQTSGNLMNASSIPYNFISFTEKENRDTVKSLRKNENIAYKKKAIAEFADLGRLMCPNINPEFQEILKNRPDAFKRPKGMCGKLCETEKGYGRKQFRKFKY